MNETPSLLEGNTLPAPLPPEPKARDGRENRRGYLRSAYAGEPQEALIRLAAQRMAEYKIDALDAIHDLAMMTINDANSAQNQVKLAAAKVLAFPDGVPGTTQENGIEVMLKSLNDKYHKDAPRIKSVRERVVTFETEPRVIEAGD